MPMNYIDIKFITKKLLKIALEGWVILQVLVDSTDEIQQNNWSDIIEDEVIRRGKSKMFQFNANVPPINVLPVSNSKYSYEKYKIHGKNIAWRPIFIRRLYKPN